MEKGIYSLAYTDCASKLTPENFDLDKFVDSDSKGFTLSTRRERLSHGLRFVNNRPDLKTRFIDAGIPGALSFWDSGEEDDWLRDELFSYGDVMYGSVGDDESFSLVRPTSVVNCLGNNSKELLSQGHPVNLRQLMSDVKERRVQSFTDVFVLPSLYSHLLLRVGNERTQFVELLEEGGDSIGLKAELLVSL